MSYNNPNSGSNGAAGCLIFGVIGFIYIGFFAFLETKLGAILFFTAFIIFLLWARYKRE